MTAEVCLIVAKNENNAIGYNGDLLFNLKGDMEYFKNVTQEVPNCEYKNVVIMGHNTWKSIPKKYKPLKNRINIVLTSKSTIECQTDEVILSNNLKEIITLLKNKEDIHKIFIIGGNKLYDEAIRDNLVDKLYITNILYKLPKDMCDTYFSDIDCNKWDLSWESDTFSENALVLPLKKKDIVKFNYNIFTKNKLF